MVTLFALIAFVAADVSHLSPAANRLDSATQGPNPQDIATPEPEYIDIDLPEPSKPKAPVAVATNQFASFSAPQQQIPGHTFGADGYRYRRPAPRVYYRRVYRRRY